MSFNRLRYLKSATGRQSNSNRNSSRLFTSGTESPWRFQSVSMSVTDTLAGNCKLPQGVNFTLLANATRDLGQLQELYKAIGTKDWRDTVYRKPAEIVVLKPESQVRNWVAVTLATEIRIGSDKHFVELCRDITPAAVAVVKEQQSEMNLLQEKAIAQTQDVISDLNQSRSGVETELHENFAKVAQLIADRYKVSPLNPEVIRYAAMIVADDLYRDALESRTQAIAVDQIAQRVRQGDVDLWEKASVNQSLQTLELLPNLSSKKRITKALVGGPASGKSRTTEQFGALLADEFNMTLSDFSCISLDRFRLALLEDKPILGKDSRIHGTLTQDESRYLLNKAVEVIKAKLENTDAAPCVLIEMVSPDDQAADLGLAKDGTLIVSVACCAPNNAVEGNKKRYEATKERLVPTQLVLGGQRMVSEELPEFLRKYKNQKMYVQFFDTDKMMRDERLSKDALIGVYDSKEHALYVRDVDKLFEFIKKKHINIAADCPTKLYLDLNKISFDSLIEDFRADFGDLDKVIFIDPVATHLDYRTVDKHVYAEFNLSSGLNIIKPEVYGRVCGDEGSPTSKLLSMLSINGQPKISSSR